MKNVPGLIEPVHLHPAYPLCDPLVLRHGRPIIMGVTLAVDTDQAATVRRIFERYAGGDSLKRIAIDLNDAGILSPQRKREESRGVGIHLRCDTSCTTSGIAGS